MATGSSIVNRALRLITVLGQGNRTPTTNESGDALEALNAMLDAWGIDRLLVYQIKQESFTWTATASRTMGSGGNFSTTKPAKITNIVFTKNSIDYPVRRILTIDKYDNIPYKSVTSDVPQYVFVDDGYPLLTLYAYPVPSASITVKIDSYTALQSFTDLTTVLSLPQGTERALVYNLAVEIAPEYGVEPSEIVIEIANKSKAALKRINSRPIIAAIASVPAVGYRANIITGP